MIKKVIFLDVDGVLNHADCAERSPMGFMGIDPEKIKILRQIIEATGASIVLSSSWKMGWHRDDGWNDADVEYLNMALAKEGLQIIDKTENAASLAWRGAEILQWVKEHPEIEAWAVLDDDIFQDFKACGIMPHLVKTSFAKGGLQEKHVRDCIEILNKERKEQS